MTNLPRKLSTLFWAVIAILAAAGEVFAIDDLHCSISFVNAGYQNFDAASTSDDPFFTFTINRSVDLNQLWEHQNRCFQFRPRKQAKHKRVVCLVVLSGTENPLFADASSAPSIFFEISAGKSVPVNNYGSTISGPYIRNRIPFDAPDYTANFQSLIPELSQFNLSCR